MPDALTPERWMRQLFSARAAGEGGVIRRKIRDVDRIVGIEAFQAEIARRGFQPLVNADQFIVLCNREPVRRRV